MTYVYNNEVVYNDEDVYTNKVVYTKDMSYIIGVHQMCCCTIHLVYNNVDVQ